MIGVIIIILILACLTTIIMLYSFVINIKYISEVIKDIIYRSSFRRINPGTVLKPVKRLSIDINSLLEVHEANRIKVRELEISQKRVISNISHDLRTPLTSLLGYLEMLQKDTSLTEEEKAEYLEIAISKGKSLYFFVQNFFELAKLEANDTQYDFEKLDISNTIKEIMLSFYSDFSQNKIQPELDLPENPVYVLANRTCIERILQNLISNALRYGKDGGIIGVALREVPDRIWVDIWDNGKGIAQKDIEHIFERLYISEKSRNNNMRGSGLGLSIAKKMIEKMNGEIFVSSVPSVKTIFSFYLRRYDINLL
ncbi:MAG: HAMP domain-containing histidine kinase [bacterium]|nr:HAMP domain-containing histidine kinase [bacterium]